MCNALLIQYDPETPYRLFLIFASALCSSNHDMTTPWSLMFSIGFPKRHNCCFWRKANALRNVWGGAERQLHKVIII